MEKRAKKNESVRRTGRDAGSRAGSPGASAGPSRERGPFDWGPANYAALAAALAALVAGYVLLNRGSVTAAPILLVLGYVVLVPVGLMLGYREADGEG